MGGFSTAAVVFGNLAAGGPTDGESRDQCKFHAENASTTASVEH
jgi:hypothetical protein